jgi:hypothetical protein
MDTASSPRRSAKCVFDARSNLLAQLSIAEILQFILSPGALPIRGANRYKLSATGSRTRHEHAYSQFVLKNAGKCNEEDRSMCQRSAPPEKTSPITGDSHTEKWKRLRHWLCSSRLLFAREPTAWIHAPSQPLMRSLLSQFQTPTAPRRTSRFFLVWLLVRSPC